MAEKPFFKAFITSLPSYISRRKRELVSRIHRLEGDPEYVAKGMAIGVLVGFTPTIPFHTILCVIMAIVLRGSKAAAVLGAWINNPFTLPLFYWISYKTGIILLNGAVSLDLKYGSVAEIFASGMDVAGAMMLGGTIAGILPAVAAYFATRTLLVSWQSSRRRRQEHLLKRPEYPDETGSE